jgi:lysophospholipase L1-like esterase
MNSIKKFCSRRMKMLGVLGASLIASPIVVTVEGSGRVCSFDFTGRKLPDGVTSVTSVSPQSLYSEVSGFGFEPGTTVIWGSNCITSDKPFLFSVRLPEGNYWVNLHLGDEAGASDTTVKTELRRLALKRVTTRRGGFITRGFVVNLRTFRIPDGTEVRLKTREKEGEMINWDERLTLEFNGPHPALRTLTIVPMSVPTMFLTGDSTVCDQPQEPWNSWGQMLPRFLGPRIAVANYAQSGESIKSSRSAKRFEKVFSLMKTNDWLLVQFGHNDMKDKATNALAVYKANLKTIVAQTRAKGATPVLVTSMERKSGVDGDTLGDYPRTVRDVAKEEEVALIDLHAMSKVLYRALGTNLNKAFQDGTHHNNYGSYELARCVVEGIRGNVPALAQFIATDAGKFDPAHPDAPDKFTMSPSPAPDAKKPDGDSLPVP